MQQFQKGLYKACAASIQGALSEMQAQFTLDFTSPPTYDSVTKNLAVTTSFSSAQAAIEEMMDFANSKLIFDITQIVKNSLLNIDKISNYLNKVTYKIMVKNQNTNFKSFESQEA